MDATKSSFILKQLTPYFSSKVLDKAIENYRKDQVTKFIAIPHENYSFIEAEFKNENQSYNVTLRILRNKRRLDGVWGNCSCCKKECVHLTAIIIHFLIKNFEEMLEVKHPLENRPIISNQKKSWESWLNNLAKTVKEKILALQEKKSKLLDSLYDAQKEEGFRFSEEDLADLFSPL